MRQRFTWVCKGDLDTFIVTPNLQLQLSAVDPRDGYYGAPCHWKSFYDDFASKKIEWFMCGAL